MQDDLYPLQFQKKRKLKRIKDLTSRIFTFEKAARGRISAVISYQAGGLVRTLGYVEAGFGNKKYVT